MLVISDVLGTNDPKFGVRGVGIVHTTGTVGAPVVGDEVGAGDGDVIGDVVGLRVGDGVGAVDGDVIGDVVGLRVGLFVGGAEKQEQVLMNN